MLVSKKRKQKKLRHAEYYDLQGTFDRLYAQSKDGKTFNNLVEIISSEENIKLAYRNIKSNKGSRTAGVDKLNIKDLNNIILNIDKICEPNQTYGLYKEDDEITFEIKFFSGVEASLSIDGTILRPTYDKAWESGYIKYTMLDHDVDVASMINGYVGDELKLCETIEWGSKITDESLDYIDVQRIYLGVAPENMAKVQEYTMKEICSRDGLIEL